MPEALNNEQRIAQAITSHRCSCKLLLKTADDPVLLPLWLKHHLTMFKPEEIIIADNCSADPEALSIYQRLPPGVVVFSYTGDRVGFHNNIHDRGRFKWLYDALRASCDYFLFLDTDEFLHISRDLTHWSTERADLVELLARGHGKAISTTWVHAAHASVDTFYIGEDTQRLAWDLRWGKPFVPSSFDQPGFRIHNLQYPLELFDEDLGANFYLLHLINFNKEQRLRVNKRKLVARSVVKDADTLEEIVSRNYGDHWDSTVPRLVSEISRLLGEDWPRGPDENLYAKYARFSAGGIVLYGSDDTESAMSSFRADFRRLLKEATQHV